jgi:hypothetical protein
MIELQKKARSNKRNYIMPRQTLGFTATTNTADFANFLYISYGGTNHGLGMVHVIYHGMEVYRWWLVSIPIHLPLSAKTLSQWKRSSSDHLDIWLVVFRHPSEKYEFVIWDDEIPNLFGGVNPS